MVPSPTMPPVDSEGYYDSKICPRSTEDIKSNGRSSCKPYFGLIGIPLQIESRGLKVLDSQPQACWSLSRFGHKFLECRPLRFSISRANSLAVLSFVHPTN